MITIKKFNFQELNQNLVFLLQQVLISAESNTLLLFIKISSGHIVRCSKHKTLECFKCRTTTTITLFSFTKHFCPTLSTLNREAIAEMLCKTLITKQTQQVVAMYLQSLLIANSCDCDSNYVYCPFALVLQGNLMENTRTFSLYKIETKQQLLFTSVITLSFCRNSTTVVCLFLHYPGLFHKCRSLLYTAGDGTKFTQSHAFPKVPLVLSAQLFH